MRALQMTLLGSMSTQYIENNEEAEKLYADLSKALTKYTAFRNTDGETFELILTDGTKQTVRLDKLCSVTICEPCFPDWLKDHFVAQECARQDVAKEAARVQARKIAATETEKQ